MKKTPNTTYLLSAAAYRQKWGWWWITPPIWKSKYPPPIEEEAFHEWAVELLLSNGVSMPRVACLFRSNAPREAVGYKGVATFEVSEDSMKLLKTFSEAKGVPKSRGFGDFWFKRDEGLQPIRIDFKYLDTVDADARRPDLRDGMLRPVSADSAFGLSNYRPNNFQSAPTL